MKVRILTMRAGPTITLAVGQVVDVSDREAKQLVEAGDAEYVGQVVETTTLEPSKERANATGLDSGTGDTTDSGTGDTGRTKGPRKNPKRRRGTGPGSE